MPTLGGWGGGGGGGGGLIPAPQLTSDNFLVPLQNKRQTRPNNSDDYNLRSFSKKECTPSCCFAAVDRPTTKTAVFKNSYFFHEQL